MALTDEQKALKARRFLRNKVDGYIHAYTDILAANPKIEEVSAEEAFPEKFIPENHKGRKAKVNMETEETPKAPKGKATLNEEASRGV